MHTIYQEVRETLCSVALLAFRQGVVRSWVGGISFAQCASFSLLKKHVRDDAGAEFEECMLSRTRGYSLTSRAL